MSSRTRRLIVALLACILTAGCLPQAQPEITATQRIVEESPTRLTATAVPTVTPNPTATLIRPTPLPAALPALDTAYDLEAVLFDSNNCKLPCWNGLVVGESSQEEALSVFKSVFDLDLTPHILSYGGNNQEPLVVQLNGDSHAWKVFDVAKPTTWVNVAVGFSKSDQKLQILEFDWNVNTPRFSVAFSPQQAILKLGVPSHMLISARPPGVFSSFMMLMLTYDSGIVFIYYQRKESNYDQGFCLNKTTVELKEESILAEFYILEPFTNGLDNLTPLQSAIVQQTIEFQNLKPIEEVIGVSSEMVAERIAKGGEVCLHEN